MSGRFLPLNPGSKIKLSAIWRTGAETSPTIINDQAVCKVDQYRTIILVQLSRLAPWFRLYKEDKF